MSLAYMMNNEKRMDNLHRLALRQCVIASVVAEHCGSYVESDHESDFSPLDDGSISLADVKAADKEYYSLVKAAKRDAVEMIKANTVKTLGDTAKFRQAMRDSGFNIRADSGTIFNDKSKRTGIRRLKLWQGIGVFDASQHYQEKLAKQLRLQFGDRILVMYFIAGSYYERQLCIKLKD